MKTVSGVTLIQLVIVLIVLSILSVYAWIKWPGYTMNITAQANQLAADLSYAQSLAMTSGQRYCWIKTSSNTYQIQNASGTAILMPNGSTTVTLNRSTTFGTLTNLPNNLVNFDGRGTPYTNTGSPGTALASTAVITLTEGGSSMTASVTPQTGRVTVP